MDDTIHVIGHKNPDADAVCAAIAYAAFKKAKGDRRFKAARCGNSNPRIDTICERFGVRVPPLISDVTPRVRDIMVTKFQSVTAGHTCAEALQIIEENDLRILPVLDAQGCILGTISVFQLGQYFMPRMDDIMAMRRVHTSLGSIARALDARILNVRDPEKVEPLFMRVASMDLRSFGTFPKLPGVKPAQSITIVGDREDIQMKAIELGVRLIIVSSDLAVPQRVIDAATAAGVSVFASAYDSATTSLIVRAATPVGFLYKPGATAFGPEERLHAVSRRVAREPDALFAVVDSGKRLLGVFSKTDLIKPPRTQLVLVDHNELGQAVDGAAEVRILEIIDHHRLANPPTSYPIRFINEPVGSTCTIIARLFQNEGIAPAPAIAGILMSGIISDTLLLQSPTSTEADAEVLPWLASLAEINPRELADLIFKSGSLIRSLDPVSVVRADLKPYEENSVRFTLSQVEEPDFNNFFDRVDEIRDALEFVREDAGCDFSGLLVTDINTHDSLFIVAGPGELLDEIHQNFPCHPGCPDIFEMKGVVSRKKQLMPYIVSVLARAN